MSILPSSEYEALKSEFKAFRKTLILLNNSSPSAAETLSVCREFARVGSLYADMQKTMIVGSLKSLLVRNIKSGNPRKVQSILGDFICYSTIPLKEYNRLVSIADRLGHFRTYKVLTEFAERFPEVIDY